MCVESKNLSAYNEWFSIMGHGHGQLKGVGSGACIRDLGILAFSKGGGLVSWFLESQNFHVRNT